MKLKTYAFDITNEDGGKTTKLAYLEIENLEKMLKYWEEIKTEIEKKTKNGPKGN